MTSFLDKNTSSGNIVTPATPGVFCGDYPHPDDRGSVTDYSINGNETSPKIPLRRTVVAALLFLGLCAIAAIIVSIVTITTQPQDVLMDEQIDINIGELPQTAKINGKTLRKELCSLLEAIFELNKETGKTQLRNCSVSLSKNVENLHINLLIKTDDKIFDKQSKEIRRKLLENIKGFIDKNNRRNPDQELKKVETTTITLTSEIDNVSATLSKIPPVNKSVILSKLSPVKKTDTFGNSRETRPHLHWVLTDSPNDRTYPSSTLHNAIDGRMFPIKHPLLSTVKKSNISTDLKNSTPRLHKFTSHDMAANLNYPDINKKSSAKFAATSVLYPSSGIETSTSYNNLMFSKSYIHPLVADHKKLKNKSIEDIQPSETYKINNYRSFSSVKESSPLDYLDKVSQAQLAVTTSTASVISISFKTFITSVPTRYTMNPRFLLQSFPYHTTTDITFLSSSQSVLDTNKYSIYSSTLKEALLTRNEYPTVSPIAQLSYTDQKLIHPSSAANSILSDKQASSSVSEVSDWKSRVYKSAFPVGFSEGNTQSSLTQNTVYTPSNLDGSYSDLQTNRLQSSPDLQNSIPFSLQHSYPTMTYLSFETTSSASYLTPIMRPFEINESVMSLSFFADLGLSNSNTSIIHTPSSFLQPTATEKQHFSQSSVMLPEQILSNMSDKQHTTWIIRPIVRPTSKMLQATTPVMQHFAQTSFPNIQHATSEIQPATSTLQRSTLTSSKFIQFATTLGTQSIMSEMQSVTSVTHHSLRPITSISFIQQSKQNFSAIIQSPAIQLTTSLSQYIIRPNISLLQSTMLDIQPDTSAILYSTGTQPASLITRANIRPISFTTISSNQLSTLKITPTISDIQSDSWITQPSTSDIQSDSWITQPSTSDIQSDSWITQPSTSDIQSDSWITQSSRVDMQHSTQTSTSKVSSSTSEIKRATSFTHSTNQLTKSILRPTHISSIEAIKSEMGNNMPSIQYVTNQISATILNRTFSSAEATAYPLKSSAYQNIMYSKAMKTTYVEGTETSSIYFDTVMQSSVHDVTTDSMYSTPHMNLLISAEFNKQSIASRNIFSATSMIGPDSTSTSDNFGLHIKPTSSSIFHVKSEYDTFASLNTIVSSSKENRDLFASALLPSEVNVLFSENQVSSLSLGSSVTRDGQFSTSSVSGLKDSVKSVTYPKSKSFTTNSLYTDVNHFLSEVTEKESSQINTHTISTSATWTQNSQELTKNEFQSQKGFNFKSNIYPSVPTIQSSEISELPYTLIGSTSDSAKRKVHPFSTSPTSDTSKDGNVIQTKTLIQTTLMPMHEKSVSYLQGNVYTPLLSSFAYNSVITTSVIQPPDTWKSDDNGYTLVKHSKLTSKSEDDVRYSEFSSLRLDYGRHLVEFNSEVISRTVDPVLLEVYASLLETDNNAAFSTPSLHSGSSSKSSVTGSVSVSSFFKHTNYTTTFERPLVLDSGTDSDSNVGFISTSSIFQSSLSPYILDSESQGKEKSPFSKLAPILPKSITEKEASAISLTLPTSVLITNTSIVHKSQFLKEEKETKIEANTLLFIESSMSDYHDHVSNNLGSTRNVLLDLPISINKILATSSKTVSPNLSLTHLPPRAANRTNFEPESKYFQNSSTFTTVLPQGNKSIDTTELVMFTANENISKSTVTTTPTIVNNESSEAKDKHQSVSSDVSHHSDYITNSSKLVDTSTMPIMKSKLPTAQLRQKSSQRSISSSEQIVPPPVVHLPTSNYRQKQNSNSYLERLKEPKMTSPYTILSSSITEPLYSSTILTITSSTLLLSPAVFSTPASAKTKAAFSSPSSLSSFSLITTSTTLGLSSITTPFLPMFSSTSASSTQRTSLSITTSPSTTTTALITASMKLEPSSTTSFLPLFSSASASSTPRSSPSSSSAALSSSSAASTTTTTTTTTTTLSSLSPPLTKILLSPSLSSLTKSETTLSITASPLSPSASHSSSSSLTSSSSSMSQTFSSFQSAFSLPLGPVSSFHVMSSKAEATVPSSDLNMIPNDTKISTDRNKTTSQASGISKLNNITHDISNISMPLNNNNSTSEEKNITVLFPNFNTTTTTGRIDSFTSVFRSDFSKTSNKNFATSVGFMPLNTAIPGMPLIGQSSFTRNTFTLPTTTSSVNSLGETTSLLTPNPLISSVVQNYLSNTRMESRNDFNFGKF